MSRKIFLLSSLLFTVASLAAGCGGGSDGSLDTTNPSPAASGVPESSPPPSSPPSTSPGGPSGSTDGCAASEPCIEADVTLTDGSTFHFARKAMLHDNQTAMGLSAVDSKIPFGISVTFKPNALTPEAPYPSDVSSAVWMSVYREHPTQPGKTRLSSAQYGSIVFTKTGAGSASTATGSFDGVAVVRDEPDDTVNIKLTNGKFRAGAL